MEELESMGTTDRTKKLVNILSETLLIMACYFLCGVIRVYLPLGRAYAFRDTLAYGYLAVLYTAVFVLIHDLSGGYKSLKFGGLRIELLRIAVGELLGCLVMTSVIYIFRLEQFSRLLLILFLLCSAAALLVKRIVVSHFYMKYSQTKGSFNVLLVGAGPATARLRQAMAEEADGELRYRGYVADAPFEGMDEYLGGLEQLETQIEALDIKKIIMLQQDVSEETLRCVVTAGERSGAEVLLAPSFGAYLGGQSRVKLVGGFRTLRLSLFDTSDILGVRVAVTDMEKTVALMESQLENWRCQYVCVANVHTTVTASEDEAYMKVQNGAVMVLPDGGPLSAYSRRHDFEEARRVTGPDLMLRLMEISPAKGYRHFFYGSTEETLERMKKRLAVDYPGLQVCGMVSPPFRELSAEEDAAIVEQINGARPDFIWVGLGAPKQEIWMNRHQGRVNGLMIGVGAGFDYYAGNIKRAPMWMQKCSLEWLYRLLQDPRRLFMRYLYTNTKFIWKAFLKDK